jgi:hypothetical protein
MGTVLRQSALRASTLWTLSRPCSRLWRRTFSAAASEGASHHREATFEELVRYARQIRAESNIQTADEPPTSPLPEGHEVGPGESDFCNYLDDHSDTSNRQVIQGLGLAGGVLACLAAFSVYRYRNSKPQFVPRTVPFWEKEVPGFERVQPAGNRAKLASAPLPSSDSAGAVNGTEPESATLPSTQTGHLSSVLQANETLSNEGMENGVQAASAAETSNTGDDDGTVDAAHDAHAASVAEASGV